ncbi:MAG: hypothetical protein ACM3ML_29225 [Micromonosporaceae bacterium]
MRLTGVRYRTDASATTLPFSRPNPETCSDLVREAGAAHFHAWTLANAGSRSVHSQGAVGKVTLPFSGAWQGVTNADLDVALRSLTLLPLRDASVAVRLSRCLPLFDAAGFTNRGDRHYSAGFETARRHAVSEVSAAFGGVNVVCTGEGR